MANRGVVPRPRIVDSVIDARGRTTYQSAHETIGRAVSADTADSLAAMMRRTVTRGTARQYFFDRRGNAFLPNISAAGKTGTLNGSDPYRGYTWFVGFAPVEDPQIAVAALVINEPRWRIKGAFVARETMRYWLVTRPRAIARAEREAARQLEAETAPAL